MFNIPAISYFYKKIEDLRLSHFSSSDESDKNKEFQRSPELAITKRYEGKCFICINIW